MIYKPTVFAAFSFSDALHSPTEHTEGSASYRKPEWVARMDELKHNIEGRMEGSCPKLNGVQCDAVPANSPPVNSESGAKARILVTQKRNPYKHPLARNVSVSSLKPCSSSSASITLSAMSNTLPRSVSTSRSSESLGKNSSISQDSLSLVRCSRSEIGSSDFGSGTYIESNDGSQTTSSRGNQTGFTASSISLGDLSMGSDSVFISETDTTTSDTPSRRTSDVNSSCYNHSSSILDEECSKLDLLSPSIKHVHFKFDREEEDTKTITPTGDNYAQSILTDYLTAHRSSISKFIKSLSVDNSPLNDTNDSSISNSSCESNVVQQSSPDNILSEGEINSCHSPELSYSVSPKSVSTSTLSCTSSSVSSERDDPEPLQNKVKTHFEIKFKYNESTPEKKKLLQLQQKPNFEKESSENDELTFENKRASMTLDFQEMSQEIEKKLEEYENLQITSNTPEPKNEPLKITIRSCISAPTTPLAERKWRQESFREKDGKGDSMKRSQIPCLRSCDPSPNSTPRLKRRVTDSGSLTRIPRLISREPSLEKIATHHTKVVRSASEPCSPILSPILNRRNSKIPLRVDGNPVPDNIDSYDNKTSKLRAIFNKFSSKARGRSDAKVLPVIHDSNIPISKLPTSPITTRKNDGLHTKSRSSSLTPQPSNQSVVPPRRAASQVQFSNRTMQLARSNSTRSPQPIRKIRTPLTATKSLPNTPKSVRRTVKSPLKSPNEKESSYSTATQDGKNQNPQGISSSASSVASSPSTPRLLLRKNSGSLSPPPNTSDSNWSTTSSLPSTPRSNRSSRSSPPKNDSSPSSGIESLLSTRHGTPEILTQEFETATQFKDISTPLKPTMIFKALSIEKRNNGPLIQEKHTLSMRKKSTGNLKRADSLEEFLSLESECMTGRK